MNAFRALACMGFLALYGSVSALEMSTQTVERSSHASSFLQEFPALEYGYTTGYVSNLQDLPMTQIANRVYVRSQNEDVSQSSLFPLFPKRPIPKINEVISYVQDFSGGRGNFVNFLKWRGGSQVSIFGSQNRCPGEGFILPEGSQESSYQACQYEKPSALYLNTFHDELYQLNAPKDQKVTFHIYPVTDKRFLFSKTLTGGLASQGGGLLDVPLMLIDPSLDYYQTSVSLERSDGKLHGFGLCYDQSKVCKVLKLTNKYKKVTYTQKDSLGQTLSINAIIPYYEITLPLTKGTNTLRIAYFTYTPHDPYGMYYDHRE